jgi:hypothetical protein
MDCIHLTLDRDKWWNLFEYGNEPSASAKVGEYFDWLNDCLLPKSDSTPWS